MSQGAFDFIQDRLQIVFDVIENNVTKENKFDIPKDDFEKIIEGYFKVKEAQAYIDNIDRLLSGDVKPGNWISDLEDDLLKIDKNKYKIRKCKDCGRVTETGCLIKGTYDHKSPCSSFELPNDDIPF
jgi:hypothetical protein